MIRDAGEKAASVRALRRTSVPVIAGGRRRNLIRPRPILAGLLATSSVWTPSAFAENVRPAVLSVPPTHRVDLACSLEHGSFELQKKVQVSSPDESLIFFILRLLERLRAMGTAPAADLMQYGRGLRSFR